MKKDQVIIVSFLVNGTLRTVMCLDIEERKPCYHGDDACYHGDDHLPELHLSLVDFVTTKTPIVVLCFD